MKRLLFILLLVVTTPWAVSGQQSSPKLEGYMAPDGTFISLEMAGGQPTTLVAKYLQMFSSAPTCSRKGQLYYDTVLNKARVCTATPSTWETVLSGAGAAPVDATFITQTPNATLTNEQALSALATGIPLITTGTGVISISNVDNTSDANKPVSTAQQTALDLKANLAGPTLTGNVSVSGGSFGLTGTISGAGIFGTSGIRYKNVASTLTDTTSSGTIATNYTNVFGNNTLAASSATTITNAFNTYISDPVQGTNVTLTNKWALGADSVKIGTSNQLTISNTGVLTATSPVFTTPALGTPASGVVTNLTGTASININGTVGATAPGTGAFTTLTATGVFTQTVSSATAHEIGPNGGTNPVLRVITNVASQADGISITGGAAGAGTTIAALSSGSNSPITLTPKGTGGVVLPNGTAAAPALLMSTASTGMFFANSTNIGFSLNGTDRVDLFNPAAGRTAINFSDTAGELQLGGTMYLRLNGGQVSTLSTTDFAWIQSTTPGDTRDLFLHRAGAANLQLGAATSATAAVAQTLSVSGSSGNSAAAALFTIAGSDQSGTTTTGGETRIRGGNGTTAGGAVTIYTSATTTPAVAVTVGADKSATFAGAVTHSSTTTLSAALTYGGVTLSNAVTGTGNMVLSASPTLSGTVAGTLTFSGSETFTNALNVITASQPVLQILDTAASANPFFVADNANAGTLSVNRHPITGTSTNTGKASVTVQLISANVTSEFDVYTGTTNNNLGTLNFQVKDAGQVFMANLSTDSGATDATLCRRTSNGEVLTGTGTLGICLGTSSERFKTSVVALPVGLAQIMALKPVQYRLDAQHGDPNKLLYGFTAEQGGEILPTLMGRDSLGRPNTFDYLGVVPVLVNAMKEQQEELAPIPSRLRANEDNLQSMKAQIIALRKEVDALKAKQ